MYRIMMKIEAKKNLMHNFEKQPCVTYKAFKQHDIKHMSQETYTLFLKVNQIFTPVKEVYLSRSHKLVIPKNSCNEKV